MKAGIAGGYRRAIGNKGRYYRRSLIVIFLVSGLPGLVLGALFYWMAGGRVESELLALHNRQIVQRSQNIDDQLSNLELMLSHWAFDSKFDSSLNGLDFVKEYETTLDISKTLMVMQGSNSLLKKVELYIGGEKPVLFNPEFTPLDVDTASTVYDRLLRNTHVTYWMQWSFDPTNTDAKDLALVHYIPGGSPQPFGLLIFRFDNEKVANLLKTMTPYNDGETFLVQDSGDLYVSAGGSGYSSPLVQALRQKIAEERSASGSFFLDWNGATYTVSFGKMSRIAADWTYVSASPITNLTKPVEFISKLIIGISACALLLAALLAWLASRSIYSPVNRLLHVLSAGKTPSVGQEDEFALIERQWYSLHRESAELHTKLAEQLPHVKMSFLHQLLNGYLHAYSEDDLLNRMERFRWDVANRRFVVLYIRMVGMASLDGKFRYGDEGLVTFAGVNMIEELAPQYFDQCDTVNFHDLTAGLLLILPNGEPYAQKLQTFCEQLTEYVNRILKLRVTIAISSPMRRVSGIPLAFERVKQAVNYRIFDNVNQILNMESNASDEEAASELLQYPLTLERELIQALRTGREADAHELLEAFLQALSGGGAKEIDVQLGMLHLLGSVQHAIMISGIHPSRLFKGANLYEQLSQIREQKLMLLWFREKVIAPFMKELLNRSDLPMKRLIEQAMTYLQSNYQRDISLDNCAEAIGTNPFFLSKSFKQVTGKNFIDYLTELRMEKAKELLRESELKINDVAGQVGYQHSYFNRIFKKLEGMTPTRFRELSRTE
jgi:AraC-like DNA-binding protein